jgi:quinol monooxygenase YgiN
MIHVIAEFHLKADKRAEFLKIFKKVVSEVKKEKGCVEYLPTVDIDLGLSMQSKDENVIVLIEKWLSFPRKRESRLFVPD